MSKKSFILVFFCLIGLFNLKEVKRILIENEKELTYVINKKQTFSLELLKNTKLSNLQISIQSTNSMNQIISFSNSDKECKNSEKYISNKSDFFINNYQLSGKKKYLCIECTENSYCEFTLSFKQDKKQGHHLEETEISLQSSPKNIENDINLKSDSEIINLYTLSNTYTSVIQIPSDYLKLYQIPGTSNTYEVSGESVGVSTGGTVYPKNETWYWYGGVATTSPPGEGQTPTSITVSFKTGKSTVTITASDKTVTTLTFNVIDYATEYADKVLADFVANNITNSMSEYNKFEKITSFPAQYPYNGSYSGYVSMIIMKGGDCWGSSYSILKLCELVGIKAHLRYGANDGGSGSGHRNVAALIDGKIYIGEGGYGYTYPNRPYHVSEENVGFLLKKNSVTKKASLLQYDGFEENIKVPEKIDNFTINELGTSAFYYGKAYSGMNVKNVELPDTIEIIGNSTFFGLNNLESIKIPKNVKSIGKRTFSDCPKIEEIQLDSDNEFFAVDDGVLYDYNKTKLLSFPTAKKGEYTGLTSLLEVDDYAFYYTTKINKLILPAGIKNVGQYAFAHSPLKEIYFAGPQPKFGIDVFESINATVYYPKNEDWDTKSINTTSAIKINFVQWEPPKNLAYNYKSKTWVWVIVIIVFVLVLGAGGYFVYRKKKKSANSGSVEGVSDFGKLL